MELGAGNVHKGEAEVAGFHPRPQSVTETAAVADGATGGCCFSLNLSSTPACFVCPNSLSPIDKRSEEALSVQSGALDFRRRPTDRRGPIQLLRCARPHARALVLSLGFSPPLQRCRSLRRGTRATALKVVYKFRCEMERRARPSRRGACRDDLTCHSGVKWPHMPTACLVRRLTRSRLTLSLDRWQPLPLLQGALSLSSSLSICSIFSLFPLRKVRICPCRGDLAAYCTPLYYETYKCSFHFEFQSLSRCTACKSAANGVERKQV